MVDDLIVSMRLGCEISYSFDDTKEEEEHDDEFKTLLTHYKRLRLLTKQQPKIIRRETYLFHNKLKRWQKICLLRWHKHIFDKNKIYLKRIDLSQYHKIKILLRKTFDEKNTISERLKKSIEAYDEIFNVLKEEK